jgi:hypothetical protein
MLAASRAALDRNAYLSNSESKTTLVVLLRPGNSVPLLDYNHNRDTLFCSLLATSTCPPYPAGFLVYQYRCLWRLQPPFCPICHPNHKFCEARNSNEKIMNISSTVIINLRCGKFFRIDLNNIYQPILVFAGSLNFNHFLMREVSGYLVHPSMPTDQPTLRIADVGTGTR